MEQRAYVANVVVGGEHSQAHFAVVVILHQCVVRAHVPEQRDDETDVLHFFVWILSAPCLIVVFAIWACLVSVASHSF
jgi:hypothetical protein